MSEIKEFKGFYPSGIHRPPFYRKYEVDDVVHNEYFWDHFELDVEFYKTRYTKEELKGWAEDDVEYNMKKDLYEDIENNCYLYSPLINKIDLNLAISCGLLPFEWCGIGMLALGENTDPLERLDIYQIISDGTVDDRSPILSTVNSDKYKSVVGKELYDKAISILGLK